MNELQKTDNRLDNLPFEIFENIAGYLNFPELNCFRRVSKEIGYNSKSLFSEQLSRFKKLIEITKKVVLDHANTNFTAYNFDNRLERRFAILLAKIGDFEGALEFSRFSKSFSLQIIGIIGNEQLKVGNTLAAQRGVEEITNENDKTKYLLYIAYKLAKHRDLASARKMLSQLSSDSIPQYLLPDLVRLYATLGEFEKAREITHSLENRSDQNLNYRCIEQIAIAKFRAGNVEEAKEILIYLRGKILEKHNVNEFLYSDIAIAQIKINDFRNALETINLYPRNNIYTYEEYKNKLFMKLGSSQLKCKKENDAKETKKLIEDTYFGNKMDYMINLKNKTTFYWKNTEYWWSYQKTLKDDHLTGIEYKNLHERLAYFAGLESLDEVLSSNEFKNIQNKQKNMALKIFASAQIDRNETEGAIETISSINDKVAQASVLVELLEEHLLWSATASRKATG